MYIYDTRSIQLKIVRLVFNVIVVFVTSAGNEMNGLFFLIEFDIHNIFYRRERERKKENEVDVTLKSTLY